MVVQSIYLNKDNVSKDSWQELIDYICKYNGYFKKIKIVIEISNNKIKYYLVTKYKVPPTINSIDDFLIKENDINIEIDYLKHKSIILDVDKNAIGLSDISRLKHNRELKYIIINIIPFFDKRCFKTYLFFKSGNSYIRRRFMLAIPTYILSVDFSNNKRFSYEKKNKYLNLEKILPILTSNNTGIFSVDAFPYLNSNLYLDYKDYDFFKHSLIVGSSGNCTFSIRVDDSNKISNSLFIQDCFDLDECMFCSHIANKKYCICNMQYEKETYFSPKKIVVEWFINS